MQESDDNPTTNQLGSGISEDSIRLAINESGYPLQTFVAGKLRESFRVQEEWAYLDRESNKLRSLDLRASRSLFDWEQHRQPRVRPALDLLIECKQSELPYIFFESRGEHHLRDHPIIHGLAKSTISIKTDGSRSTWAFNIIQALGLDGDPFQIASKVSKSFSKCVRKGSKLELSGTESYFNLILPLVKALDHLGSVEKPPDTAIYFDAHLSIAIGILDAPMLVSRMEKGETVLEFAPWVRVVRQEYADSKFKSDRERHWIVDVVHKDYFEHFINVRVEPFAAEFATRVLRHPEEIATSKGFVSGMEKNSWRDIESRMGFRE